MHRAPNMKRYETKVPSFSERAREWSKMPLQECWPYQRRGPECLPCSAQRLSIGGWSFCSRERALYSHHFTRVREGFGFGTLLQKRRWGFGKGGLAWRRRGKRAIWKGIAGYLRMAPKEVGRQINVASAAHGQVRDESLPIPCFRTPSITLGPH